MAQRVLPDTALFTNVGVDYFGPISIKRGQSLFKRMASNVPAASHQGDVWERLIHSIRSILVSVLKKQALDDEGLQTVLCEAEAILNDRPITRVSNDSNDLEALTPNYLLLLKNKPILPPEVFDQRDLHARKRWKWVQCMAKLFWKRWLSEYLPLMQERQKWQGTKRCLIPGDIVLIADATAPRGCKRLGGFCETPNKDLYFGKAKTSFATGSIILKK